MATGWTLREVGDMTLHDLADMHQQWKVHPPTYLLIESYVGYVPPEEPKLADDKSIRELAAMMGA